MWQKINVPSLSGENGFDIAKLWCCGSLSCNNWEWLLCCNGYESKMGTLSFIFMKRNLQVKVITLKTQYIIDQYHTPSTYLYSVPWIVYQLISNLNFKDHNPACFSWASCATYRQRLNVWCNYWRDALSNQNSPLHKAWTLLSLRWLIIRAQAPKRCEGWWISVIQH